MAQVENSFSLKNFQGGDLSEFVNALGNYYISGHMHSTQGGDPVPDAKFILALLEVIEIQETVSKCGVATRLTDAEHPSTLLDFKSWAETILRNAS